jgi:multidrug transporter EmrE-like cation transporter
LGLNHRDAVLVLYALAVLFGALSLVIPHVSVGTAYALAGITAACGIVAAIFLEKAPYERQLKLQKSVASIDLK